MKLFYLKMDNVMKTKKKQQSEALTYFFRHAVLRSELILLENQCNMFAFVCLLFLYASLSLLFIFEGVLNVAFHSEEEQLL